MATAVAQPPTPKIPRTLSLEGLVTIVGAVILFLTIVLFNLALINHLDTKIDNVRTELKADIEGVRTELKVDIEGVRTELKADIEGVRTELKTDIDSVRSDVESVRMELKADIDSLKADIDNVQTALEADIQRLDDRLFAVIVPPPVKDEEEATP
ncbi:MAG: hypothetical protein OXE46_07185 [Chloroflexi bacterium]|nr:hypothetical protein [Chloroflexota bacterium]